MPCHFVHVECKEGHFVLLSLGIQTDQLKVKMEPSKKLITFSMLFELVEHKWFRNPPKILQNPTQNHGWFFPQPCVWVVCRIKMPLWLSAKDDN